MGDASGLFHAKVRDTTNHEIKILERGRKSTSSTASLKRNQRVSKTNKLQRVSPHELLVMKTLAPCKECAPDREKKRNMWISQQQSYRRHDSEHGRSWHKVFFNKQRLQVGSRGHAGRYAGMGGTRLEKGILILFTPHEVKRRFRPNRCLLDRRCRACKSGGYEKRKDRMRGGAIGKEVRTICVNLPYLVGLKRENSLKIEDHILQARSGGGVRA